jgi:hypothetical protein
MVIITTISTILDLTADLALIDALIEGEAEESRHAAAAPAQGVRSAGHPA